MNLDIPRHPQQNGQASEVSERVCVLASGRELHGSSLHDVSASNQMAGKVGQPLIRHTIHSNLSFDEPDISTKH